MADPVWPQADPSLTDGPKLLYESQLAFVKEKAKAEYERELDQQKSDEARIAADEEAIRTSITTFNDNLMEVSKAAIDRARAGAEAVQKAAGAIGGAYTGVLALAFSVSERPLPSRGLVPTVLFGWAIVWSTAYLAYLTTAKGVKEPEPTSSFPIGSANRSATFILWIRNSVMNRKLTLRVSVIALAFGLALLPAPFLDVHPSSPGTPTVASTPAWPAEPENDTGVGKVRYEAEVKEVAELRTESKPIADDGDDSFWWILCVVAVIASVAIPVLAAIVEITIGRWSRSRT